jgi:hypothetical protein
VARVTCGYPRVRHASIRESSALAVPPPGQLAIYPIFLPAERFRHVFLGVVTKAPLRPPAFPARLEHRNR